MKYYLHHINYNYEELGIKKIDYWIQNNKTIYYLVCDKSSKKFGDEKRKTLEIYDINKLPKYIKKNLTKYKDWID